MSIKIKGSGRGDVAKVTTEGQLETLAVTKNDVEYAAELENAYFAATDIKFLTNTSAQTSFAWLRNDSANLEIHVDFLRHSTSQSDTIFRLYANPATVSAATTVTPVNTNFGSGKTAEATFYTYSTAAQSFTGGSLISQVIPAAGATEQALLGAVILKKNDALLLSAQTPTSAQCAATLIFHYVDPDVV